MSYIKTFKRYEKKYFLTREQYTLIQNEFEGRLEADSYGLTTICSIYYDTDDFELIRNSIEKPVYKEKLRLRSYGVPTGSESTVFLEIKKKYKGVVFKRRADMTLGEARLFTNEGVKPNDSQIVREIDWLLKSEKLSPKVFLAYDRLAMFGIEDKDFRVTFDFDIRWRETELDMTRGDFGESVTGDDSVLMEIKSAGAIPMWLCSVLSQNEIYPVSFSKYGTCYKDHIIFEYLDGGIYCA